MKTMSTFAKAKRGDHIMTTGQKELVKASFEQLIPIADTAAALFYARLFELDPELSLIFKTNMVEQGRKLIQMIAMVVTGLDRLSELLPALEALGARHASYGVRERDYETVGNALIWAIQELLGDDFTVEIKEAWVEVYSLLASAMQSAPIAA
jgi:hemoglobin-like flavoprotein